MEKKHFFSAMATGLLSKYKGFSLFKKTAVIVFVALCIFAFAMIYFYLDFQRYINKGASCDRTKEIITIDSGHTSTDITEMLYQHGIIKSPFKFNILVWVRKADKGIKAGEYSLSPSMSPNEILDKIVKGKMFLRRLTIPEGYTLSQIASLVEQAGIGKKGVFLAAATNASFVRQMDIPADSFEGYLFPDTYYFYKGMNPEKMIVIMVNRFWSVFTPDWIKRAETLGFSVHQIVILASIIEKETGAEVERPLISSVFHNRLKKGMRLESDPTVIYGIPSFDGNITKEHLKTKTPYNTYQINGLPAGPISNPGVKSIEAALYPEKTRYLYFVSKNDSTHYFSNTLKAHKKAVRKYQLKK